jgi:integrase
MGLGDSQRGEARPTASGPDKGLTVPPPERVRASIDKAAASRSPEWATIITMAALSGLRRGELCGLQWGDIDWKESALTVSRSIWQTKSLSRDSSVRSG